MSLPLTCATDYPVQIRPPKEGREINELMVCYVLLNLKPMCLARKKREWLPLVILSYNIFLLSVYILSIYDFISIIYHYMGPLVYQSLSFHLIVCNLLNPTSMLYLSCAEMGITGAPSATVPSINFRICSCCSIA